MCDPEYRLRVTIKRTGAEEARGYQLHCRLIREDNHRWLGRGRTIAWNVRVLGRFRCAYELGISIPAAGRPSCEASSPAASAGQKPAHMHSYASSSGQNSRVLAIYAPVFLS